MKLFFNRPSLLWLFLLVGLIACAPETPTLAPPPTLQLNPPGLITTTETPAAAVTSEPAGVTPGAESTPTSEPTPTLMAVATATTAPIPASNAVRQTLAENRLPGSTHSFLYLKDGSLKRWNHQTGQFETLEAGADPAGRVYTNPRDNGFPFVGDVVSYAVSADGKRAAAAHLLTQQIVHEEDETGFYTTTYYQSYEIVYFDLVSGQRWTILPRIDHVQNLSLSPDGSYLAFTATSTSGDPIIKSEFELPRQTYVMETGGGNPGVIKRLNGCTGICSPFVWNNDGNLMVWSDHVALWLQNVAGSLPEALVSHTYVETDILVYRPQAWAKNGRFVLLEKLVFENLSGALLDVPTKKVMDVPNSGNFMNTFYTDLTWMPDDRLYVVRSAENAQLELWRPNFDTNTVTLEESLVVGPAGAGVVSPHYLPDGRFAYLLVGNGESDPRSGLYHLTSFSQTPQQLTGLAISFNPLELPEVRWAADGSEALIIAGGVVSYGSAGGKMLYLVPELFKGVSQVTWLP